MKHVLKSWPRFFSEIITGRRTHELRNDDRQFSIGDSLHLEEFDPQSQRYTGRSVDAVVTSLTSEGCPCAESDNALASGFVIMSIKLVKD
jgi:hypothetical protein